MPFLKLIFAFSLYPAINAERYDLSGRLISEGDIAITLLAINLDYIDTMPK